MEEREINFTDLLVEMLLNWRMIIIWMIMGGLVMGIFSYIYSVQFAAVQKAESERQNNKEIRTEMEEYLTLTQKNNVRTVISHENFKDYYNRSLLVQVDAANIPKTELVYLVKANSPEQNAMISYLYESVLVNGIVQWLAENSTDYADININELVTVSTGNSDSRNRNYFNRAFL